MKEQTLQALRHVCMNLQDLAETVHPDHRIRLKACAAIVDFAIKEEEVSDGVEAD